MKMSLKKRFFKAAVLFTALLIPLQTAAANYGDNVLTDPFSEERPAGDVNLDGSFNIKDLIRLKKYASGMAVTVDLGIFAEAAEEKAPSNQEKCGYNYAYVSTTDDGECVYATTKDGKAQSVNEDKYIYNTENNTGNQLYAGILFVSDTINEPINISAGDGVTFYVKTECANTILPLVIVTDPAMADAYDPDMSLKIGSEYSYRTVDGDWITAKATVTGQKNDGEKDYFGVISFDEPFEGYIRLPFSSLSHSDGRVRVLDDENNIVRMLCKAKSLGGEYGGLTFGHIRVYSENGVGGAGAAETLAFLRKALLNG